MEAHQAVIEKRRAELNDLSKVEKIPRPGHAYGKEMAEEKECEVSRG